MKHFLQTNLEKTKLKIIMPAIINAAVDKYLVCFRVFIYLTKKT